MIAFRIVEPYKETKTMLACGQCVDCLQCLDRRSSLERHAFTCPALLHMHFALSNSRTSSSCAQERAKSQQHLTCPCQAPGVVLNSSPKSHYIAVLNSLLMVAKSCTLRYSNHRMRHTPWRKESMFPPYWQSLRNMAGWFHRSKISTTLVN